MSDCKEPGPTDAAAAPSSKDKILVAVFWVWAAVLVVATLAQIFRWQGVLDVLDVKNWFAR
jgi:hypothetical protein